MRFTTARGEPGTFGFSAGRRPGQVLLSRRRLLALAALVTLPGALSACGAGASAAQRQRENEPSTWTGSSQQWRFEGARQDANEPRGLVFVLDIGGRSTVKGLQRHLTGHGYSNVLIQRVEGATGPTVGDALPAAIATLIKQERNGLPLGLIGLGSGGQDGWPLIADRDVPLFAAVMIDSPYARELAFTTRDTMSLLTLYAAQDALSMATYDGSHHALMEAEIHHEMITYGDVGAEFYNEAGRSYNEKVSGDAYRRTTDWLDASPRAT